MTNSNTIKLLLLSNSPNVGEQFLGYPESAIIGFLGEQPLNIAFIPYAGVTISYDDYTERVTERMQAMGYRIRSVHSTDSPKKLLLESDVIMIGGGNTFHLLNELYQNDLLNLIREEVLAGKPYIGWSAGSNVACPTIMTTNDMPIIYPPVMAALNLIPFQLNPHYTDFKPTGHGGESRSDRLREFLEVNQAEVVVGLFEGSILKFSENRYELLGDKSAKLFQYGQNVIDIQDSKTLNDYLVNIE